MSVGERISALRKEQGISQGQLSEALQVFRQAVSKWENDLSSPDTLNLIKLAEVLDTDVEYLSTGRRSYGRRPPVVIKTVETVEVEKVVEKPVIQVVEKTVEVPVVEYIEKPVVKVKKVYRDRLIRNPVEFLICGGICFVIGLLVGILL